MVLKVLDLTVSTLGGYGSLEKTDFNSFYFGRCGSLETIDFNSFYFWEGVAVLKKTDFNSFYFGKGVASLESQLILTVSTL